MHFGGLLGGIRTSERGPFAAMPRFAILSQGKLFVAESGGKPALLESPFAEKAVQAALEVNQAKAWKGATLRRAVGFDPGEEAADPARVKVAFTAACADPAGGGLLYCLQTESAGGLFQMALPEREERRLFHMQRFLARDIAANPDSGFIACSLPSEKGTAALVVMNADGSDHREVTGGDCVDSMPSWVPGNGLRLVYQSAGIARDPEGHWTGQGAETVCRIDLVTKEVETLLEDPRHDFLAPRQTAAGDLLCIRRPHEVGRVPSFWQFALTVVLFPVRLAWAVVAFLNAFSLFFTQKPLIGNFGRAVGPKDQAGMVLRGRWIETKRALRDGDGDGARGLVPDTWELLRRTPDGRESVLAKGVLAYALGADGTVYFTNGRAIFQCAADGSRKALVRHGVIEDFCLLPEASNG